MSTRDRRRSHSLVPKIRIKLFSRATDVSSSDLVGGYVDLKELVPKVCM